MLNRFKLGSIVIVQKEGYRHYGEVLSRETPDSTYMVRRVPGHPGTLEEMKASILESCEKPAPHWVHYAVVKGVGSFPVDMLRYDFAAPVNFEIVQEFVGPKAKLLPDMPSYNGPGSDLVVATCSRFSTPRWTYGRWSSFLWGIKELRSLPVCG